ncbi:MAG TPA: DNA polymerase/3'-5' exonuclease PolX, partial [Dehalococcoidia bacterium]|nr:DNA polymerase/3'-5' exonuclease PolX [Dehalococcoidia bacterium]
MTNGEIAEVFERISGLLEMKGEKSFTIRAYQRASRTIERLPTEVDAMVRNDEDLTEIPGIGKAISEKISELVNTGDLQYLMRLKDEFPPGILDLMEIPGLGPKTTVRVWKELGVTTVDQLEAVVDDGSLAALPRLGKKSAENIRKSIKFARSKSDRVPIARAMSVTRQLTNSLREGCPGISQLIVCGSLRRFEETIGDVDLICVTEDGDKALNTLAELPDVADVLGQGGAKTSVVLKSGLQVDMRVTPADQLGAMLQYFTGNLQHNVILRDRANSLGLSLNEYGLKDVETGDLETFVDEESLYDRLGMQFVPPEIRMGESEVSAALAGNIPKLVDVSDLKGDLHAHTDWSDGRDPMETMVEAAKARGLEYIAMTDHSVGRGIANGLSIERLKGHMALVREVEAAVGGIRVFCGTEMDIRADGSLDYADEILKELDWVVASVHSAMGQDAAVMTERVIAAMKNPYVSAIGHLSTRLIGERKPIEADYEAIFRAAADTGTVLEIN